MNAMVLQAPPAVAPVMAPMPLPADWIISGEPVARGVVTLSAHEGQQITGLWECTAGSFRYEFTCHETVYILEGEATITDETGQVSTLRPGDFAHFPCGLTTTWVVERSVKKVFFIVNPPPAS